MIAQKLIIMDDWEDETPIWRHTVLSELEALSHAAPNEIPQQSLEQILAIREVISGYVDSLSPEKRHIIEQTFYGPGLSVRALAAELTEQMQAADPKSQGISKSQIFRLQQEALYELRMLLLGVDC